MQKNFSKALELCEKKYGKDHEKTSRIQKKLNRITNPIDSIILSETDQKKVSTSGKEVEHSIHLEKSSSSASDEKETRYERKENVQVVVKPPENELTNGKENRYFFEKLITSHWIIIIICLGLLVFAVGFIREMKK